MKQRKPVSSLMVVLLVVGALCALVRVWPAAADAADVSLWTAQTSAGTDSGSGSSVEVGVKFKSSQAGLVTGVRFYKVAANTGKHVGHLWTSGGSQLASVTFRGETTSGWQTASFSTPVTITANTSYVVSYYAPVGHVSQTPNYFSTGYTAGVLTAPGNDTGVSNGIYRSGSGFPNRSSSQTNYWVDLVFRPGQSPTTTSASPSTTSPSPTTTSPSPTITPGPNPLASRLVGGYWEMWDGPNVSVITANAPQYNLQYAAFALGSDKNGHVVFNPVYETSAALKTDIIASKAAGNVWLLSLGGGGDTTIRLTSQAQATTMYNDLVPIIDSYGFQGIDYDLECGSTCFNPGAAAYLASLLKGHYGSGFVISATPRPYELRSSSTIYGQFALLAGDNVDIIGMQDYDFPEANNVAQLTAVIDGDLASVTAMGIPASKILIGCITYSKYQYGHNTVDTYKTIYLNERIKYPSLRGVFIWDTQMDQAENWTFAHTMGPAVVG